MRQLQAVLEAKDHEEARDTRAQSPPVSKEILIPELGQTGFAVDWACMYSRCSLSPLECNIEVAALWLVGKYAACVICHSFVQDAGERQVGVRKGYW